MNIQSIAQQLDEAASKAQAIPQISSGQDFPLDQAYAVQALSLEKRYARGEKLIGLKMGFTSKAKMEQMGVHELIWGRLTDKMLFKSGTELSKSDFIHPRAEPEIAFQIKQDITEPLTIENAHHWVSGVALALEIIDSRYQDFKFSLSDVVADNCSSAAFVLGDWADPMQPIMDIKMSMVSDDVIVGRGNSNAILGNPWESLVEASRLALKYGQEIKAGYTILAGAATSAVYLKQGETISAHAEGFGSVYLDIV